MRILICEDDPSRSEALGASVGIACPGAEVQRAVPGTSAARAVAEAAPALTIVGPGLADADGGSELVRVLCTEHPELAVLVVSTRDLAAPAGAALRAGCTPSAAAPRVPSPVNGAVSPRSATGSRSSYESPLAVSRHQPNVLKGSRPMSGMAEKWAPISFSKSL